MIEVQKEIKPSAQPPGEQPPAAIPAASNVVNTPKTTSMSLSEPAEQIIPNTHGFNLEQVVINSTFSCLNSETMVFRLNNQFHFMQFQADTAMRLKTFETIKADGMLDCCLLEAEGKLVVLTKDKLLQLEGRSGRVIQKTLQEFPRLENVSTNPYKKVVAPEKGVLCLLTTNNKLEMHSLENDSRLRLLGSTGLNIQRQHYQTDIVTLMMERRLETGKYMAVAVCRYSLNNTFETERLFVLEIELKDARLICQPFEVVTVQVMGHLQVKTFILFSQAPREYLQLSLNNEILVVCRFINRYMIWQCIYHKKIKEEAKTCSFGLLRYNLFYIVEKFLLELYQFSFLEDKKTLRTIIKVELAQFTPDENGGVRPSLGYSLYPVGEYLETVLLNCTITPQKISLFFRCSVRCEVANKLDQMVALIQHHKELQPELDKATLFMAGKMKVSQEEIQKEIWKRWPRVLERNSHSIRKLIQVGEPHYIEKQLAELLQKNNLKLDLVEDILVKCQALYRKQLLKQFTWQTMRRLVKCNFKVKKVRLYMLTCRAKEISLRDWQHLKQNDMDREIKSYFPEFRKVDLELALGLFPHYFLTNYYENLCHAFSLIKDVVYFVSNFNFLFPSKGKGEVWELNIDRKELQLTKDKLSKIYAQSKKKDEPFETIYASATKGNPKYMVNNDVYTSNQPLSSFDQAYYLFFSALVESAPNMNLELAQKVLTIFSELNNIKKEKQVHIGCIMDLYFATESYHESIKLKQMFELSPEALFEKLLELEIYEVLIKIVKPVFDVLQHHRLSESFEKYLNRYMCRKTVFNKHFTQILVASKLLPQDQLESILEAMLDCIYYSMEISHAGQVQNYIQEYFLVNIKSDILREKILRLQSILAHEEEFTNVDPKLKLIEIQLGEEVFHRKIEQFLQTHTEQIERGEVQAAKFGSLMTEMKFLREELYEDYTEEALFNRLLKEAFERLKVWKHFIAALMQNEFPVLPSERKKELLDLMVQAQKNAAYKAGSIAATIEMMHALIDQYSDPSFSRIERLRLEFIAFFEPLGLAARMPEAADLRQTKTFESFENFVDSQIFLKCELAAKNRFIELLFELSGNSNARKKIQKLRVRELEEACETALENSDYESFLECLQEHLTRSKPQDFDVDFKILWVRFIGQLIHEIFWNELGLYILRKCLYLIPDFKEAMNQFFAFLTRDSEEIFRPNPIEHIKLRTSFLKKKGRQWVLHRIQVIEGKVKKSLLSKNILEFMFRHLLVSQHRLAFAFLKSVLKHVDIENIYKTCIICLESEYFTAKLDMIRLLMQIICLQFSRDYDKETDGKTQLNDTELLKLILKLRPNAKDQQSRNKLTFFESIISNCLKLRTFYEKLGEDLSMGDAQHDLEMSGSPGVQMETILQSLVCFNESVIPMLRGASTQQNDLNEQMSPLRIGDDLVDSFDGEP